MVTSPIGGIYEQTNSAGTSHSVWFKNSGTGNTGWRQWAGLRGTDGASTSLRLGDGAAATGTDSIALGENTTASALRAVAIGKGASATATDAHAFGNTALASGVDALAWGRGATASGARAEAIGQGSVASADDGKAIGAGALVAVAGGVAIGLNAAVNTGATNGVAIGSGASIAASKIDSIALGNVQVINSGIINIGNDNDQTSAASGTYGSIYIGHGIRHNVGHQTGGTILIGQAVETGTTNTFSKDIGIGDGVYVGGFENVIIGESARAWDANLPSSGLAAGTVGVALGVRAEINGDCVIAIGHDSFTRSDFSCAVGPHARGGKDQTTDSCNAFGRFATAIGHRSMALGANATVADTHTASIAMGYNALTTAAAQLMIGDDAASAQINTVHFNGSSTSAINVDSSGRATFFGTFAPATITLTAGTTLDATHGTVRMDTGVGNLTLNLPAAAGAVRRVYTVIKVTADGNTVTIDGSGAETINGATTYVLNAQYQKVTIQSNGTSWDIIG